MWIDKKDTNKGIKMEKIKNPKVGDRVIGIREDGMASVLNDLNSK